MDENSKIAPLLLKEEKFDEKIQRIESFIETRDDAMLVFLTTDAIIKFL